jgi:hypothetical protein
MKFQAFQSWKFLPFGHEGGAPQVKKSKEANQEKQRT